MYSILKKSVISDLRKQLNLMQHSKSELIETSSSYNQKSAFMEEFEELMPSSELNDYINLQKEIKRLNEENFHLSTENKELIGKLKHFKQTEDDTSFVHQQDHVEKLETLEQEIFVSLLYF